MLRSLAVVHVLGMMLVVFSAAYIMPIVAALISDDGTLIDFVLAMIITFAAGSLMWLLTDRKSVV